MELLTIADMAQNTDRAETIKILSKLLEVSVTTYQRIRVYLALVPARLDYSQNLSHMPQDSWISCRKELHALITLLLNEPDYVVTDQTEEYDDMADREPEVKDGKKVRVAVRGNLIGMLENLDNEVSYCSRSSKAKLTLHSSPRQCNTPMLTKRGPITSRD